MGLLTAVLYVMYSLATVRGRADKSTNRSHGIHPWAKIAVAWQNLMHTVYQRLDLSPQHLVRSHRLWRELPGQFLRFQRGAFDKFDQIWTLFNVHLFMCVCVGSKYSNLTGNLVLASASCRCYGWDVALRVLLAFSRIYNICIIALAVPWSIPTISYKKYFHSWRRMLKTAANLRWHHNFHPVETTSKQPTLMGIHHGILWAWLDCIIPISPLCDDNWE